ncbi:MAG TPA: 3D domain-containing protein, partial [Bradyrhizobium sp.]
GSAITGPARADLYFGAGADAARVSGRLKNNMHFVMLVPKSLDPTALGRKMPLPDPRPSAKIAKLFPQTDPQKTSKAATPATPPPSATAQAAPNAGDAANTVPLPAARPDIKPDPAPPPHRRTRHHRGDR